MGVGGLGDRLMRQYSVNVDLQLFFELPQNVQPQLDLANQPLG
jgi:hypothetical protein